MQKRLWSFLLALCLVLGLAPSAGAADWNMEYFLQKYSDSHFDLRNDPDAAMTVEEFIAILYAYSYYGDGSGSTPAKDRTGRQPSAWCAKYVQAEVEKGTVTPGEVGWSDPVTVAFAAQFLSRSKGKYSYDSNNLYTFSGTSGLTADEILYCSVAVDHGLISYKAGMNVAAKIKRKDALRYEIPQGQAVCRAPAEAAGSHMREVNAYYVADVADTRQQLEYLKDAKDDVTMVTVGCGYLQSGGGFLRCDLEKPETKSVIELCQGSGKLALLGIINYAGGGFSNAELGTILSSDGNIDAFVSAIVSQVEKNGFDGVNMGIEVTSGGLPMRQGYAKFLTKLAGQLHSRDKVLMTTVGAYFTDQQQTGSFYDYKTIGQVSDYVHVILYDDFNDSNYAYRKTAGPMSNLVRVGRVMRYCATAMPKEKLLLGMGSFAIDYDTTALQARDISYDEAMELQRKHGVQTAADMKEDGAHFAYTDGGHSHLVYFETAATAANRAKLINRYGLCGASVYYLGGGHQKMFGVLTGLSSCKPEIMQAMEAGLIPISLRGSYEKAVTRQEFCQLICAFVEAKTGSSVDEYLRRKGLTAASAGFTDTTDSAVLAASALGIVNGYGDGLFKPQQTITRQEAATMLTRLAKVVGLESPNAGAVSFAEADSIPQWYQEGVRFISACQDPQSGKRVMGGVGGGRFDPAGSYTREQSLMTLIRLYHIAA